MASNFKALSLDQVKARAEAILADFRQMAKTDKPQALEILQNSKEMAEDENDFVLLCAINLVEAELTMTDMAEE